MVVILGGAEELKRKKFNLTIDICFIIGYNGTITKRGI